MTYAAIEASTHDANAAELYEFTMGAYTWRQTSSVNGITYAGNYYEPNPLERPQIELSGEISRQTIEIGCSSNNEIAQLFITGSPENMLSVRIFQGHVSDGEYVLIFAGRVLSCKWAKQYKATLTCEPIYTSLKRGALKCNFGVNCPYVVYSDQCGASRNYLAGVVQGTPSGLNISVDIGSTITNGRLIGGTITIGPAIRTITYHNGDNLKVTQPFVDVVDGQACSLLIGCDKSLTACNDWHDNLLNHGGEPYIADQNPFVGRII